MNNSKAATSMENRDLSNRERSIIDGEDRSVTEPIGDRLEPLLAGVAMGYALTSDDQEYVAVPMLYSFELADEPNYVSRAYRQDRRLRGKKNESLPGVTLLDEVIVVAGAGMGPEDTIAALRKMIRAIESDGLMIGKTEKGRNCVERLGRLPRFVDSENAEIPIQNT